MATGQRVAAPIDSTDGSPLRLVVEDTRAMRALGAAIGAAAAPGDVVCLFGDLGAGKTQLVKGMATGLGIEATVNSPSFVLMTEHEGRLPLFHVDLYRLADAVDVFAGGLLDERQANGIVAIEWAERLAAHLPAARLDVRIDGTGDRPRAVELRASDERHRLLVAAVARSRPSPRDEPRDGDGQRDGDERHDD